MSNKYFFRSKISEEKFRRIVRHIFVPVLPGAVRGQYPAVDCRGARKRRDAARHGGNRHVLFRDPDREQHHLDDVDIQDIGRHPAGESEPIPPESCF